MASQSLFSCRIVDITSYLATPVKELDVCYSVFRSNAVAKVPVVLIFGSTPTGQKTCLHVHGVFPYIFVPCHVTDPSMSYLQLLACSIDQALNVSMGSAKSYQHHVFKITVVKGTPMYGYHDDEELFFKIYLYNPALVKRLSELLVAGVVMGTVLQPHESHIPFVLQMMIDYNLYGMNFIHLSSIKFRAGKGFSSSQNSRSRSRSVSSPTLLSPPSPSPLDLSLILTPSQQVWDVDSLSGSMMVFIPRISESELELDALAADIINTQQLSLAKDSFPGLAAIWEEERIRRKQLDMNTDLTPPLSPDRLCPSMTERSDLTATLASIIDHRLNTRSLESDVVAEQLSMGDDGIEKGAEPLVNEDAIHQTMQLSQKLNIESLRKSTDEELLDLMLELAQTQVGMATQASQSVYKTQTVVDSFRDSLITKSQQTVQPSPSFLTPLAGDLVSQSQPLPSANHTLDYITRLTGSQPVLSTSPTSSRPSLKTGISTAPEMQWQDDVDRFLVTKEDFLLNQSNEFKSSNTSSTTMTTTDKPTTTTEVIHKTEEETTNRNSPVASLHSPVFSDDDLFDSDFSLPPSPPLAVTSGDHHQEFDELSLEERENELNLSVMLNGSSVAIGNISVGNKSNEINDASPEFGEGAFDIPCAQRQRGSSSSDISIEHVGSNQDILKPDGCLGSPDGDFTTSEFRKPAVNVQLEYEMPEISISQLEAFDTTTAHILGTPSKMTSEESSRVERVNEENDGVKRVKRKLLMDDLSIGEGDVLFEESFSVSKIEDRTSQRQFDVSVAIGDVMATDSNSKITSTPFRSEGNCGRLSGLSSSYKKKSVCLSASQRRLLIQQLFCASCELSDGCDGSEGGEGVRGGGGVEGEVKECVSETEDEEEEEEEDELWMSHDTSTPPLTIPESPQGNVNKPDDHIRQMDDCISQLDGTSDDPKKDCLDNDRQKKSNLCLSLKSSSKKRKRNFSSPSSPSSSSSSIRESLRSPPVASSSLPLSQSTINSHPLATQWKSNAVLNPPQVNIPRISTTKNNIASENISCLDKHTDITTHSTESESDSVDDVIVKETAFRSAGPRVEHLPSQKKKKKNVAEKSIPSPSNEKDFTKIERRELSQITPVAVGDTGSQTSQRRDSGSTPKRRRLSSPLAAGMIIGSRSSKCGVLVSEQEQLNWAVRESLRDHFRNQSFETDQELPGQNFDTVMSSSQSVSGCHGNSYSMTVRGSVADGNDSFIDVIPDPECAEKEFVFSSENRNERMECELSPSEGSSQDLQSDFNLAVTESEDEEEKDEGSDDGKSGCGHEVKKKRDSVTLNKPLSSFHTTTIDPPHSRIFCPLQPPPSTLRLMETAAVYGLPTAVHPTPHYGNPNDVQPPQEVNRKLVKIPSKLANDLPEAEPLILSQGEGGRGSTTPLSATGLHHWKTILSMLSGNSESTETSPSRHPLWEQKTTQSHPQHITKDRKNYTKPNKKYYSSSKKEIILTPVHMPPSPSVVEKWMDTRLAERRKHGRFSNSKSTPDESIKKNTSQLEGPTPQNTYGFRISQSDFATSSDTHEYLTTMSVEVHTRTRGSLRPDPECDPVLTIFYYIHHDYPQSGTAWRHKHDTCGVIAIDIKNCDFKAIDISRRKLSPRKRPIRSPRKSLTPMKSPKTKHHENDGSIVTTNQIEDSGCCHGNSSGVQSPSRQLLNSTTTDSVAKGYLSGCVSGESGVKVIYVSNETELFNQLVITVRRHDPDILLGYEVTMMSWGYLIDRAAHLNLNLTNQLSRTPHLTEKKGDRSGSGTGMRRKSSSAHVQIPGRIVLSVWRLLRKELALTSYTFESTFFQVMQQRVPMFSFQTLTHWYETGTQAHRAEVVDYYLLRCYGNYQLLEKLNVIGRTSEFARLYGIEFENVLTRGSQYRVESMLLRLAKPANYIAVSPSVQQRARMAAPECLPLILEPESKFYSDPVLVLDFQSLYPSIVIGYNYCYTTCLGRVRNLALHGNFTLGTNSLNIPPHVLKKVKNDVSISPNGVVFVNPSIRRGLMPRMLEEILGTRIMVKNSMKRHAANKALNRMLDARQMGLKLIANVTYGYTAANFSGRMPCVEVADSIVGKARETLERAIRLISDTTEWKARVVYGDTDSVFVLLRGASKEEAFRIGKEICDRVTADNPKPVKLKFEKVYYPCILQTKKRYCGYMYETPDQSEPRYDAKGIETVRRDTCPAVAKTLQKALCLLFSSCDLSLVKRYVQRQMSKLLDGHVSVQDHILAKEYRGNGNYRPGACVPALELARKAVAVDRRAEPRPGERVPYVVVYGHPGQPLIQLVRPPLEVVMDTTLRLNGVYYVTKQVLPALHRALSLLGVDVYQWYNELPRVFQAPLPQLQEVTNRKLKGTLGQYFATMHCPICKELTTDNVCSRCRDNPQKVATILSQQIRDLELAHHSVTMLCHSCTGSTDPTLPSLCLSLDCPVLYRRYHTLHTLPTITTLTKLLHSTLPLSP